MEERVSGFGTISQPQPLGKILPLLIQLRGCRVTRARRRILTLGANRAVWTSCLSNLHLLQFDQAGL